MTTLETLKAARKKIEDESHWTFNEYARTINEGPSRPNSHKAYSFCAIGAICSVTRKSATTVIFEPAYEALSEVVPHRAIHEFNDSHTHAEVLRAFDEAIAKLEAQ